MHSDLILDPNLRDWVFIPLTLAIVMMNMLRQFAHTYMNTGDSTSSSDVKEIREQHIIRRSKRLRMVAGALPYEAFARRKAYFVGKFFSKALVRMLFKSLLIQPGLSEEDGVLQQEVKSVNMQEKMMSDPSMMTNMMKKQLTGTAPHLLMGFVVNQFFAGFIMGKGILSLIFSGDTIDESAVMKQSMAGASPAFDAKTEYNSEKQRYDLVDHKWIVADAEKKAVRVLRKRLGVEGSTKKDL